MDTMEPPSSGPSLRLVTADERAPEPPEAAPGPRECLPCYVARMLEATGRCDHTLRWALHWRDRNAPRRTGLARRLEHLGGYCDCEVLFNVFPDAPEDDEPVPCAGVPRPGSAESCR